MPDPQQPTSPVTDRHAAAVALLHRGPPGVPERNLAGIVEFLGGTVKAITVADDAQWPGAALERRTQDVRCLFVGASALNAMGARKSLLLAAKNVLVYGFGPEPADNALLRELTGNALIGIAPVPAGGGRIAVSTQSREVCRQLTGIRFSISDPGKLLSFVTGAASPNCETLMSIEGKPFFVRVGGRDSGLMLLAGERIPDLDAPVPRGGSILDFLPGLAPVMMILRRSAPDEFWHADRARACFIIDDPLLRERYGCVDFRKLSYLMEQLHFRTSVAFIPWNYRRSDRRMAELFSNEAAGFSLCIHGCDHSRGEFGGPDAVALAGKARLALERMARHRELSGVGFDDVMVFPQGIFSKAALQALDQCGYLAAVNSTAYPVDGDGVLRLRDLLQVAVTRFPGVPLFTRRYPGQLAELAFDLFVGKPALVVEHHSYFRDGYEPLAGLVEKLRSMDDRLEWLNLDGICSEACLQKRAPDGMTIVRFFTDRFRLRNDTGTRRQFVLLRELPEGDAPITITADDCAIEWVREGESARIELTLEAGATADLKMHRDHEEPAARPARAGPWQRAHIFVRRHLSEFRDNCVQGRGFAGRTR